MKRKIVVIVLSLTLFCLAACSQSSESESTLPSGEPGLHSEQQQIPQYTNMADKASMADIAMRLEKAGVPAEKVAKITALIESYNKLDSTNVKEGYQSLNNGYVSYNMHSSPQWDFAYEDLYCRSFAFLLAEDYVSCETPLQSGKWILAGYQDGDRAVIEQNPNLILDEEATALYYTLFNPVEIPVDADEKQRSQVVIRYWEERGIEFGDARISLVTVWNDYSVDDTPCVFSGHAGVLIQEDPGLLLLEKTNPLYPYQATLFTDTSQVKDYLISARVEENKMYGEETGILFVMVNDKLL